MKKILLLIFTISLSTVFSLNTFAVETSTSEVVTKNTELSAETGSESVSESEVTNDTTAAKTEISATEKSAALVMYADGNIVIDGYFDDWADKPKVELTYDGNDGERQGNISAYRDDEKIYLYAQVRINSLDQYDGSGFRLSAGGKTIDFQAKVPGWEPVKTGNKYDLDIRDNSWNLLGNGRLSMQEGSNELEFTISISSLLAKGFTDEDLKNLEFSNYSYGKGSISLAGTSTYPAILICFGIIIAGFAVSKFGKGAGKK
ncbi:MAG: hypothetical protein RR540_03705 [Oscillospiraceae bacterium]